MTNTINTSLDTNKGNLFWVRIALDLPLFAEYDYSSHKKLDIGTRVIIPFSNRKVVGMVVQLLEQTKSKP